MSCICVFELQFGFDLSRHQPMDETSKQIPSSHMRVESWGDIEGEHVAVTSMLFDPLGIFEDLCSIDGSGLSGNTLVWGYYR